MSAISIITEAIENAASEGIAIEPGACFDWTHAPTPGKPRAVNWAGAVLWAHRGERADFSSRRLGVILGIDRFWYYSTTGSAWASIERGSCPSWIRSRSTRIGRTR